MPRFQHAQIPIAQEQESHFFQQSYPFSQNQESAYSYIMLDIFNFYYKCLIHQLFLKVNEVLEKYGHFIALRPPNFAVSI